MADIFSKTKRSSIMSKIKGRGNRTTELKLVSLFREKGIRGWRRHVLVAKTRPDFIFSKERLAVFIDGCFWHGCPKHCRIPSSNVKFWKSKIARNRLRDKKSRLSLRKTGWHVVRIWEHELHGQKFVEKLSASIATLTQVSGRT